MTPIDKQTQQARSLALSIWLECHAGSAFDQEKAGAMIDKALAQRERETWIKAEQDLRKAMQLRADAPELVHVLMEAVCEFCHEKADLVQP